MSDGDDERPPQESSGDERDGPRQPLSDDERARLVEEELKRLKVAELARDMMVSLVAVGYQKLGLTTETRPLRDLDDARLAIEVLRGMIDVLARERGAADIEAFRSTLDAMQLNYVRAAGSDSAASEKGESQSPANTSKTEAGGSETTERDKPPAKARKKQAKGKKPAAEGGPASDG